MDDKIDPLLTLLAESVADTGGVPDELTESGFFGVEEHAGDVEAEEGGEAAPVEVQVLVQSTADREVLEEAGLRVRSHIGDVFTGTVALERLAELAAVDDVERIESAREMVFELDLAIADTGVDAVHTGPPGRRGAGVIVGIVDSGVDYTHPCFRNADGSSRILFIWDQTLTAQRGETAPAGFGYGVEYSNAEVNTALNQANPFSRVRHRDGGGHGSHVAGIAAGNGRASSPTQPAFRFVGVAPEADLIVVRVGGGGTEGFGTSPNALDAVNYCYQRAQASGNRPCVVNMSLGDNLGPHDGTSLLERGIDNLLGPVRRAFVKSAGNVGSARHHAGGTVAGGATVNVGFAEPAGNTTPDLLDFWYGGGNTFRAQVIDSAGNATALVNVGNVAQTTLAGGNVVRIDHRNNDTFNGDKRIFITITRGTATQIRPGNWSVRLRSLSSGGGGRFDGWIQRHNTFNQRPTFNPPFESNDRTISTPGTCTEVITAANYITRGPGVGGLAASSSRGPTRDGRAAPTIAAPGTNVFSARAEPGTASPYVDNSGTSMSAPHIAGVIALMFQKNPALTQAQIRNCLTSNARVDAFTGPVPNTGWGAGKVDAQAAVNCVPSVRPPLRTVVQPQCADLRTVVQVQCFEPRTIVEPGCFVLRTRLEPFCPGGGIPQLSVVSTCPSLVDGCPSTPAGCDPRTIVIIPGVINPGVINPGVINPGVVNPGVIVDPVVNVGRLSGVQRLSPEAQVVADEVARQLWEAISQAAVETGSGPEMPSEGYFEYDDSWFDDDGPADHR
jgi:subtilisin family serine protease